MASPVLAGKLEAEIKIKSDPNEFFHSFGGKAHKLPNLCSEKVHGVNVHQGDWKTKGSVKLWTYAIDGKVENLKERLTVDEESKTVTAEAIGGHILEQLKSYKASLQVIPKGGSNYAKWTIEYENINENEPAPTKYLHWLIHAGKDVDASLVKA